MEAALVAASSCIKLHQAVDAVNVMSYPFELN
jgi:hypothetical protein